jgi:hypothetical protein
MSLAMTAIPAGARQEDHGALRLLIGASACFVVLTACLYAWMISWAGPFPRDGSSLVVGRDFLSFWMYGRAAWTPDPSRFYDPLLYKDALAALLGAGYPGQNWSYPPSIMLVAHPGPKSRAGGSGPDRHPVLSDDLHERARDRRELRHRYDRPGLLLGLRRRRGVLRFQIPQGR